MNDYDEEKRASVIVKGKKHEFVFRPQHDDPAEGATLTGVYDANTGERLRPSKDAEHSAWAIAHRMLGI